MIDKFRGKYRFLSNFYFCLIRCKGQWWKTSEHLFQGTKTTNSEEREKIRKVQNPADAKMMGRLVQLRPRWDKMKLKMMKEILRMKFTQDWKLRRRLLATEDERLVEGNFHHDNFWGKCYCSNCENKVGLNHLGKLLMEIRKELRE